MIAELDSRLYHGYGIECRYLYIRVNHNREIMSMGNREIMTDDFITWLIRVHYWKFVVTNNPSYS